MPEDAENPRIRRDIEGHIRHVDHTDSPYQLKREVKERTAANIAVEYIKEVLDLPHVRGPRARKATAPIELRQLHEKSVGNITVVEFGQEVDGLPVWCSGVAVSVNRRTLDVLSSTVTYAHDLKPLKADKEKLKKYAEALDAPILFKALAFDQNLRKAKVVEKDLTADNLTLKITSVRPIVYRYDASARQRKETREEGRRFLGELPRLTLPEVGRRIEDGKHFVVIEVMFTTIWPSGELNWRVFIEPETGSAVYVRPLVAHVAGLVYDTDPLTTTGDNTIVPSSATVVLNALRTPRPLPGIVPASPQALAGSYVEVRDILSPSIAPPTVASGNFDYDANTDDFSAVNAYYHSDGVFRMVEEMGFDMATYFDGTSFPVPVDHRGKSGQVNAKAPGNAAGDGSDGFRFGVVETGQPVGIATDVRIVLHEFGHAILWDNVWSPNFGFAHSAGDSLAAILCDPRSSAADRYMTFPWLTLVNPNIDRRHDRDVTAGWAWGGAQDDGQYGSEQILSTSHFRAYLALGGATSELCEREFAARYMSYLIICGVGVLTPTTNANSPEDWVAELTKCDRSTHDFEGHPGGMVHKVIRWAFEMQGAYQPAGTPPPVKSRGAPPEVDVYINDGRNGEYEYIEDYCHTPEIWNRHRPDGGAAHQQPKPGAINHAYAIVKNRGTEQANKVRVKAYHRVDCRCGSVCCCGSAKDMIWPNDFKPMLTHQRGVGSVASGGYAIVGPFEWIPGQSDCMLMIVDAFGDPSNAQTLPPSHTVSIKHFVPWDNNVAVRELCEVCGAVWE